MDAPGPSRTPATEHVTLYCTWRPSALTIWPRGQVYLPVKKNNKILPASQTVATARITPKICQGQPPTMYTKCSRFHPNRFTFGGVIAECVNSAKSLRIVNPIFGRSLASSRIIKQQHMSHQHNSFSLLQSLKLLLFNITVRNIF